MGVPLSASFLFFFSGIGVLFGSLWIARGLAVGAGILIAALAAPVFLSQVPAQYSDLPLATYYVGACAMGMLAVNATRTTGLLALSGLCAGLGCWTKNEGLLFALMLGAAVLLYSMWARAWKSWLLPFAAGLAPGVLVSLAFKLIMAPSTSHALVGSDWNAKIVDFGRWGWVIGALASEAWNWNPGLTHPAVIIGALLFACGWRWRKQEAPAWLAIAGTVVLTLFGYIVVLVTTTNDLEWQTSTALSRLLVHLWLPALFLAGLLLDVPVVEQPQTATPAEKTPKRDAHARKRR